EINFRDREFAVVEERGPEAAGGAPVVDDNEGLRLVSAGEQRANLGTRGGEHAAAELAKADPRGRSGERGRTFVGAGLGRGLIFEGAARAPFPEGGAAFQMREEFEQRSEAAAGQGFD